MRETGLRGLGWGWRRPGAAWPNKGKCSLAGQWGAGRCVLGLRLWGVEGVLGRLLGPNRERGQRLGGGARPSVYGPVSPGVKRTLGLQRPCCCSQQTRTCSLGLEGAKGRTSPHPCPSFVPMSPSASEEPKRRREDSWAEPPPHPTALPGRGPWANDAP